MERAGLGSHGGMCLVHLADPVCLNRCIACGRLWGVVGTKIRYCECAKILRMRGPGFYVTAWNGTMYVVLGADGPRPAVGTWGGLAPSTRAELFARSAWSSWHASEAGKAA